MYLTTSKLKNSNFAHAIIATNYPNIYFGKIIFNHRNDIVREFRILCGALFLLCTHSFYVTPMWRLTEVGSTFRCLKWYPAAILVWFLMREGSRARIFLAHPTRVCTRRTSLMGTGNGLGWVDNPLITLK